MKITKKTSMQFEILSLQKDEDGHLFAHVRVRMYINDKLVAETNRSVYPEDTINLNYEQSVDFQTDIHGLIPLVENKHGRLNFSNEQTKLLKAVA